MNPDGYGLARQAARKYGVLCGHERKSGDVCGEEFAAQARRKRRAYPSGVCKERATPPGPQRTAARMVASHLAWGFVARRSQPHCRGDATGARAEAPRASPQAKWGATNVTGFALMTTKAETAKLLAAMKP